MHQANFAESLEVNSRGFACSGGEDLHTVLARDDDGMRIVLAREAIASIFRNNGRRTTSVVVPAVVGAQQKNAHASRTRRTVSYASSTLMPAGAGRGGDFR